MSRNRSRSNNDVCGDCAAPEPTWASVNKGIFLCVECCSVHRSFGRHVSQVKSLSKSHWSLTQLNMVQTLNNNGVNNIWEHCLHDNNSKLAKRKPQPRDPLHPTKADFIRQKHQQLQFVFRPNHDDTLCTENELGKQLHSSVRSANLETSIRLLIQGADPNYFHDEKGTTPLHVAAKANQILQAELLVVYGADPSSLDAHGVTPIEYARAAGNKELADRLVECMYEVIGSLYRYVSGKKLENPKQIVIPELGHTNTSDPIALEKLQKLSNKLFEELVVDVYDEIDRRETDAIWLGSSDSREFSAVPFLPVDPGLSTTRNQGRQKLARFTSNELKQIVSDILGDIIRRKLMSCKDSSQQKLKNLSVFKQSSQLYDDDPLYDSVASDEDYAILDPNSQNFSDKFESPQKIDTSTDTASSLTDVELLTRRLLQSDCTISDLRSEVRILQTMVEKLNSENSELRSRLSQAHSDVNSLPEELNLVNQNPNTAHYANIRTLMGQTNSMNHINNNVQNQDTGRIDNVYSELQPKLFKRSQRPTSMYETREGLKTPNWQLLKNQMKCDGNLRSSPTNSSYDPSETLEQKLNKCTMNITDSIHEFWKCFQEPSKREGCIQSFEKVRTAVLELVSIIPKGEASENIKHLLDNTSRLQSECVSLQQVLMKDNTEDVSHYIILLRSHVYEVARATKLLVTKFIPN